MSKAAGTSHRILTCKSVIERTHGGGSKILLPNETPLLGSPCTRFVLPAARELELWLSSLSKGKGTIYLKVH